MSFQIQLCTFTFCNYVRLHAFSLRTVKLLIIRPMQSHGQVPREVEKKTIKVRKRQWIKFRQKMQCSNAVPRVLWLMWSQTLYSTIVQMTQKEMRQCLLFFIGHFLSWSISRRHRALYKLNHRRALLFKLRHRGSLKNVEEHHIVQWTSAKKLQLNAWGPTMREEDGEYWG